MDMVIWVLFMIDKSLPSSGFDVGEDYLDFITVKPFWNRTLRNCGNFLLSVLETFLLQEKPVLLVHKDDRWTFVVNPK
jgi:hypothetical protein